MSNFDFSVLNQYLEDNNIKVAPQTTNMLEVYGNKLIEWNEKINLSAITEPDEIVIKHFIDCLSVIKYLKNPKSKNLIDVGSGAGFPGLVLKIALPELNVSLLDGHAKRFIFIEDLEKELGISTNKIHLRAELAGKDKNFRESFDFVTARAVANLNTLSEYTLPLVKVGGNFISMKGPQPEEEIKNAKNAIKLLGGEIENTYYETLPGQNKRSIIVVKKISQTLPKYPRISAKISKQPL